MRGGARAEAATTSPSLRAPRDGAVEAWVATPPPSPATTVRLSAARRRWRLSNIAAEPRRRSQPRLGAPPSSGGGAGSDGERGATSPPVHGRCGGVTAAVASTGRGGSGKAGSVWGGRCGVGEDLVEGRRLHRRRQRQRGGRTDSRPARANDTFAGFERTYKFVQKSRQVVLYIMICWKAVGPRGDCQDRAGP